MSVYNLVARTDETTVVSEHTPVPKKNETYESEAELEKEFIRLLQTQGYEYLQIHTEQDLVSNLRKQIERLNDYRFSDSDWDMFFTRFIANSSEGIVEKTRTVQVDYRKSFTDDNGDVKNIDLIDKKHIHNNCLQVINQYENTGTYDNRYDVTILVNGLPLVHVELKRRGVAIREAFNQIERYQRDSFWANSGLYEYIQIFVISNGTSTKYYSNTTRFSHIEEFANGSKKGSRKTSNSFEFTSYWTDAKNRRIDDLVDFAMTFFYKPTLLNILTKYCVFTAENLLLVMRPYQIEATEKIISKIITSSNYKQYGKIEGGGFVWHTTGSGKTLTSFKTAQLAAQIEGIEKVLFVVDRKDLDYQTMKEYDRFEKGAANSNKSTTILKRQLEDPNCRIIITTIQKLAIFIKQNKQHPIYNSHIVMIFDECHRSQYGTFHASIVRSFKKYHIFGFTGTPIFAENAGTIRSVEFLTTEQTFGERLHTYTIIDAINDGNVLPFKVDIVRTIDEKVETKDKEVYDIDRDKAMKDPRRISEVVSYIREHFNQKTKRTSGKGFNSIFATSSIEFAKLYYSEFKAQQSSIPDGQRLRVATIFSYGVNEEVDSDGIVDESPDDTDNLDESSRDFLERAIMDYNLMYHTSFSTAGDGFQNYYKDVSMRMKHNEIDVLIVVNMFLTGFDATTLNTLWVDKNLKYHGLLQAFSRTNRILNSVKAFGNIVCFRNLEERVNEALQMFGNGDAGGIILLRSFDDYYNGYDDSEGKHYPGYKELIDELLEKYPLSSWNQTVVGETAERKFIALFGSVLKMLNLLSVFDEFEGKGILTDRELQDYQSHYNDMYEEYKRRRGEEGQEKEIINDDVVFEIELVKQLEVNIDYILDLISKIDGVNNKEIIARIKTAMGSAFSLRSKVKLIEDFIDSLTGDDVNGSWKEYIDKRIVDDLNKIIDDEHLKQQETVNFVSDCLEKQKFDASGTSISSLLPPISRFGGGREAVKSRVVAKLKDFFDSFWDLGVSLKKANK